jgi:hypothetical protein
MKRHPHVIADDGQLKGREPFLSAADTLLRETGCVVRKWRTNNTGRAFTSDPDWSIEVPHPRGPVSFAVFAHEVGHQSLHRDSWRPRWLEELEAWEFAYAQFKQFDLPGVERSQREVAQRLRYLARKLVIRKVSARTAREVLDRYPTWVWTEESSPADAAWSRVIDVPEALEALAAG